MSAESYLNVLTRALRVAPVGAKICGVCIVYLRARAAMHIIIFSLEFAKI